MMKTRVGVSWDVVYIAILLAGAGVTLWHLTLGMYHLAFIAAVMTAVGAGIVTMERVPAVARVALPDLALRDRVTAPLAPVSVRVQSREGGCAWDYRTGNTWAIDPQCRVTPQLCQAAVLALGSVLKSQSPMAQGQATAPCRCPLAQREVVFAIG